MNVRVDPFVIEQDTHQALLPAKVLEPGGAIASLNHIYKSKLFNLRLKKRLTRALSNNSGINHHRIRFEVEDGVVRVYGYVDTPGEKRIIGDLVNMKSGYKKVCNEISIRSSLFINDAQIVGAILHDLSLYLGLDLSKIAVEFKNSTAYLRGFVPTIYMKCAAEELVSSTPRVTNVVNLLKIMD